MVIDVLRDQLGDMAKLCFRWICKRHQMKIDKWHARLNIVKNTAYAWRQMVFFLALLPDRNVADFILWAEDHLSDQSDRAALAALFWEFRRRDTASRHAIQALMVLFVLAGFVGFVAHFHGSAEYQLELNPDMSNWELLEKILRAKAPPLLAPGMILQLGLLGLAYVFSDSRFRRSETK